MGAALHKYTRIRNCIKQAQTFFVVKIIFINILLFFILFLVCTNTVFIRTRNLSLIMIQNIVTVLGTLSSTFK